MLNVLLSLFYSTIILQTSPDKDTTLVDKDLAYKINWLYQEEVKEPEEQFIIDISDYIAENTYLEIQSDEKFYLFSHSKLIGTSNNNNAIDLPLDSLRNKLSSDTLIVFTRDNVSFLQVGFYNKIKVNKYPPFTKSLNIEANTPYAQQENLIIFLILIFLVLLTTLKVSYPKKFQELFSFSTIFSTRPVEGDNLRLRLFEQDGLFTTLLYTFATAIIIFLYINHQGVTYFDQASASYISFFQCWIFIIVLLIIKISIIFILSALYKTSRINTFYIKELIIISALFITLFLTITMLLYFYNDGLPEYWGNLAKYVILIMYLIRMGLLYFKILKLSGFTYLYLFSYFCATEILPLVLGLKYFY